MGFFSKETGIVQFKLFGVLHIAISILLIVIIIMIYRNKEKIKKWKYHDCFMRYFFAILMFVNMGVYYISEMFMGTYNPAYHLPLHFCFISGYLFMYALITNNKRLYQYAYFFSFAGPLPAMILPDLTCGFDRFIFWQFIISHHVFMIASLYCLFVLEWKIEKNSAWRALVLANLIFLAVFIFNQIFDTNYIMTDSLPEHVLKLMPFLVYIDYPILWLELAGLAAWGVAYIPVWYLKYDGNREQIENSVLNN